MDAERLDRLTDHLIEAILRDPLELCDLADYAVMVTLEARAQEQFCGLGPVERDRRLVEWLKDRGISREAAKQHYGWSETMLATRGWKKGFPKRDPWASLPDYIPPDEPAEPKPVRMRKVYPTECSVCGSPKKPIRRGMCEPHYRKDLAQRKQVLAENGRY